MNNGFTLIELLAVIVILTIILLISIPIIGNVIENSKKSAFKSSAKGYMEAAKLTYITNEFEGKSSDLVFEYENGIPLGLKIEHNGSQPQNGIIMVNKGQISFVIHNGEYCATKNKNSSDINITKIDKEDCDLSLIVLRPLAVISMTPTENITIETTLVFNHTNSIAYEGKTIELVEWENKEDTYQVGEHTVKLRVTDSDGVPSEWEEITFTVEEVLLNNSEVRYIYDLDNKEINSTSCLYNGHEFTHILDKRDDKTYKVTLIGEQCWISENLKYTGNNCLNKEWGTNQACRLNGGTGWSKDEIMYQWQSVMDELPTENNRGICPLSFHVPSDSELKELEVYLGMTPTQSNGLEWRGTNQGAKIKLSSPSWDGTNLFGFSASAAGFRVASGVFSGLGSHSYFWSSTTASSTNVWTRTLNDGNAAIYRSNNAASTGASLRCILD